MREAGAYAASMMRTSGIARRLRFRSNVKCSPEGHSAPTIVMIAFLSGAINLGAEWGLACTRAKASRKGRESMRGGRWEQSAHVHACRILYCCEPASGGFRRASQGSALPVIKREPGDRGACFASRSAGQGRSRRYPALSALTRMRQPQACSIASSHSHHNAQE